MVRVPYYENLGRKGIFCGIESDQYVLVDFEKDKIIEL